MQDLNKALDEINAIRSQIARSTEFRGYGPTTLAATGALAVLGALGQALWLDNPASHIPAYLTLWVAIAGVSVLLIGYETATRSRRIHSALADDMIQAAAEQFLPVGAAGVLLTAVLLRHAPQTAWMLPGLWQIVFSLGVFASCRFLPRAMFAVGIWYLGAGLACLAYAQGENALSPWAMGIPFCVGQLWSAAVIQNANKAREQGSHD